MSTAQRQVELERAAVAATVSVGWTISGGSRLEWTLGIADAQTDPRPTGAEASLLSRGQSRALASAAADDIDLVHDASRSMLHARVRVQGHDALVATFRLENGQFKLCYASTTLLASLGIPGGRYEIEADR